MTKEIFVTCPFLPPLTEFIPYLEKIWASKTLTNGGPFHQQFEKTLGDYLGVKNISLFTNGTIALITALKALKITGEVITTPYSFVATAHSLLWNGIKPVFVDIDPDTMNLDPKKIEAAITPRTQAILPVHCYGIPCDVKEIKRVADKHHLYVIYDAAHACGVEDSEGSISKHGDLSVLSFHATKVFNTFEGGAIVSPDEKTKRNIDQLKNFGFTSEISVETVGINGKMSEFNAALGLLQLKYLDLNIGRRKEIFEYYSSKLVGKKGIKTIKIPENIKHNYSYFPILADPKEGCNRDHIYNKLRAGGIYARKYFYPLISDFPMYKQYSSPEHSTLSVAETISNNVLCLPLHPELTISEINFIIDIIHAE